MDGTKGSGRVYKGKVKNEGRGKKIKRGERRE